MDVPESIDLVTLAVAMLPNCQEKSLIPTAKAWAVIMPDVDFETGKKALIKIMREKKFPTIPLPAEILEAAREISRDPSGPPTAIEAWEEVRKKVDIYRPAEWSHPLIRQAVGIIGARTICESEFDLSTRFMKVYEDLVRRERIDQENAIAIRITDGGRINLLGGQKDGTITSQPVRTLQSGTKGR